MSTPTAPTTRQVGAVRPMQAAYVEHLETCRVWCWLCADLMKAADIEAGQGPRGFAPDAREWDGWR